MNLVMTGAGRFVEVQGTAEGNPFTERQLAQLLALGRAGIARLTDAPAPHASRRRRAAATHVVIPSQLVLATANPGKIAELRALVGEWGPIDVRSLADFPDVRLPEETGRRTPTTPC